MGDELLRDFIREAVIAASDEYMKKERVREHLQAHIVDLVRSGEVQSDEDLAELFATMDMAMKALSAIPFPVWQKLAG